MGGICGFVSKKNITLDDLGRMNDTLDHRGPDDTGAEIYVARYEYMVGLAEKRLYGEDPSYRAHQPMRTKDGRISIVFDGDIYNDKDLRSKLSDYPFSTASDTEVIIAGYLKWGVDVFSHLNGPFAIALYDADEEVLFLARDAMGQKPLYYETEEDRKGQNLYFASTLKPIMTRPSFKASVKKSSAARLLCMQYISGPDTIFENIYKVLPGQYIKFSFGKGRENKVRAFFFHQHDIRLNTHPSLVGLLSDGKKSAAGLKELIMRSLDGVEFKGDEVKIISSHPVIDILLGGIIREKTGMPCRVISPESISSVDDLSRYIKKIPKCFDEPFADPYMLVMMHLSDRIKKDRSCIITGTGADVLFMGSRLYEEINKENLRSYLSAKTDPYRTQYKYRGYSKTIDNMILKEGEHCLYPEDDLEGVKDIKERRLLLDLKTFLPDDRIIITDRTTMQNSLRIRSPFLDKDVFEFSLGLRTELKFRKGRGMYLLRSMADEYAPEDYDFEKIHISAPIGEWLRGPLKQQLLDLSSLAFLDEQGIYNKSYVKNLVTEFIKRGEEAEKLGKKYTEIIWAYFIFQQWYEEYFGN